MGHLLHTVDAADMIKGIDGWRESAVKAEYLVGYHQNQRQNCVRLAQQAPMNPSKFNVGDEWKGEATSIVAAY